MLSALELAGFAAGKTAADQLRRRVAGSLSEVLPGVAVTVEGEYVVLSGRWLVEDERLRWIAGLLR